MAKRNTAAIVVGTAAGLATGAVVIAQGLVPQGENRVKFPDGWDKGVLYGTIDRPDTKQYREFYTSAEVIKAVREGKPIPDGAVLSLAAYAAKLDASGNPIKDGNGRYVKDKLVTIGVMEKRAGWGADIPAAIRNGDWNYQQFLADGKINDKANLTSCYQCHLPFAKDDYLTNLAKLAGKFPSDAKVPSRAGATEVAVVGFAFGPAALKIAAGQSVTWTNGDDTPHQITIVATPTSKEQRSEVMLKGQSATLKFDEAGNIAYICGLHPTMKGTIEVVKP